MTGGRLTWVWAAVALLVCAAPACTRRTAGSCLNDSECGGSHCDPLTNTCAAPADAGDAGDAGGGDVPAGDANDAPAGDGAGGGGGGDGGPDASGDARDGGMDGDGRVGCTRNEECLAGDGGADDGGTDGGSGGARVCEVATGECVGCLASTDCAGRAPVCDVKSCRACRGDSECADPGICMPDGHCATAPEVVFVEFKASGCAGADGSSAAPYCAPNDGVAALTAARNVLVIRGPVGDRMQIGTTGVSPFVVGKKGALNANPVISAGPGTAVQVTSDEVLICDLAVAAGTGPTAKGIVATGSAAKLTLERVTVNLGMGLGIEANTGATLRMDRCLVENNSAGGLSINGAGYDIQNSVFAANGSIQLQFASTSNPGTPRFRFNSVVASSGIAAQCDVNNLRTLSESIIVGGGSCNVVNSIQTMPTFSTTRPYHLTAATPCPSGDPASAPAYDVDGELRTVPFDCGADEYVP